VLVLELLRAEIAESGVQSAGVVELDDRTLTVSERLAMLRWPMLGIPGLGRLFAFMR
jgi:hypothetical protein